jgi:hypothetical protein
MALHTDNMEKVQDWGENPPPDIWYHVRIVKAEEGLSKESNEPVVNLHLKIQDEPYIGRVMFDSVSLQKHALFKLKAYYGACEYYPAETGHDPDQLLDRECYVKPLGKMHKGESRLDIKPFNIKPLRGGRPQ